MYMRKFFTIQGTCRFTTLLFFFLHADSSTLMGDNQLASSNQPHSAWINLYSQYRQLKWLAEFKFVNKKMTIKYSEMIIKYWNLSEQINIY
jgi:hypothetical protein